MSEIVNLKSARKARARAAKEIVAQANRVKHGIAKSKHQLAKARAEIEARELGGRKLDKDG
jgi:hypothetical protein